nr:MAG TPA: major tail protein [Caudoviricetes sp.]
MAYGLMTMYGITAKIGTSKAAGDSGAWTYAPFGDGIDNLTEALNEVVQQYFFLTDKGFAKNHVTGMAPTFTVTGRRIYGDAAQDYIFGKKYGLDDQRISSFQLEYLDASEATVTITCDCTIANMQEFSGATTDDTAISMEIRFDGKPEVKSTPKG